MSEAGGPPPGSLRLLKSKMKSGRRVSGGRRGSRERPTVRARSSAEDDVIEVGRAGGAVDLDGGHTEPVAPSQSAGAGGAGGGPAVDDGFGDAFGDASPVAGAPRVADMEGDLGVIERKVVEWTCGTCERKCIPVREESRCLCGHRLKEHPHDPSTATTRPGQKKVSRPFACANGRCNCRRFFFVVAEGAWVLRCRCKHKHIDHDASAAPHKCKKPSCKGCTGFDSPWVCNCAHPWADHKQKIVTRKLYTVGGKVVPTEIASELFDVRRGAAE